MNSQRLAGDEAGNERAAQRGAHQGLQLLRQVRVRETIGGSKRLSGLRHHLDKKYQQSCRYTFLLDDSSLLPTCTKACPLDSFCPFVLLPCYLAKTLF